MKTEEITQAKAKSSSNEVLKEIITLLQRMHNLQKEMMEEVRRGRKAK